MEALIVYDSFFGNTEKIAQAIGQALGSQKEVGIVRVGDLKPDQWMGLRLLVVGSPTRAFRPSPAINGFLGRIPRDGLKGVKVAAFDTRVSPEDTGSPILRMFVKLFGYAARPMSDRLVRKGGEMVIPPEGFFVKGSEGPLKEGELERAAGWAQQILARL